MHAGVDDLIRETVLQCLQGRNSFRGEGSVRGFLFAIARNVLYDRHRRDRLRIERRNTSVVDTGTSPRGGCWRPRKAQTTRVASSNDESPDGSGLSSENGRRGDQGADDRFWATKSQLIRLSITFAIKLGRALR